MSTEPLTLSDLDELTNEVRGLRLCVQALVTQVEALRLPPIPVTGSDPAVAHQDVFVIVNEWPLEDCVLTVAGTTVDLTGCENMDQLEAKLEAAGLSVTNVAEGAKLLDTTWADNDPDDWAWDDNHVPNFDEHNILRRFACITEDGEHWVNQWDGPDSELLYGDHTQVRTLDDVAECLTESLIGNGETMHLSDVNPAIRERMKGLCPECFYFKGD